VLVVVVVLGLLTRKAVEHDDEDDKRSAGFFLIPLVLVLGLHGKATRFPDFIAHPLAEPFLPVIKTKGPRHDGGS
jgi:hypothetical protein